MQVRCAQMHFLIQDSHRTRNLMFAAQLGYRRAPAGDLRAEIALVPYPLEGRAGARDARVRTTAAG